MKNAVKTIGFALIAAIGIMAVFTACNNGATPPPPEKPPVKEALTGTVAIDGVVKQGETVTANVEGSNVCDCEQRLAENESSACQVCQCQRKAAHGVRYQFGVV